MAERGCRGWTLGGKLYRYSGRPFSVTNSLIQNSLVGRGFTNDFPLSSSFPSTTTILADRLSPASVLACGKGAVRSACLQANQFASVVSATNPAGQINFGTTAPNSFRGPGFFSISTRLSKTFPVTESARFNIGAGAYNLLNHTNLAVPNSNLGASGCGLITSTVSSPTSVDGTGQGAIVSGRVLVVVGRFQF